MASCIPFDTLKFVKRLKEAGFDEAKAEALSEAMSEARASGIENLAAKQDLTELRLELRSEIKILKWMTGLILAGIVSLILKSIFT